MSLRVKMVGAFLLIALLVPILGGVAVRRVHTIRDDTRTTDEVAVPAVLAVHTLEAALQEQQRAVLAYVAGGLVADRDRYGAAIVKVDQAMLDLRAAVARSPVDREAQNDLVEQVAGERATFDEAARQLVDARLAIEQASESVRVKAEEIVLELTILRNRFAPAPPIQVRNPAGSGSARPVPNPLQSDAVRVEVSQMLFGVEGMMSDVGFEAALSSGYAITLDPRLRQRFEDARAAFGDFLKTAKTSAGADDLPTILRVEVKFYQDFEPAARALMAAADTSAAARRSFTRMSDAMGERLGRVAAFQSERLAQSQQNAQAVAGSSARILVLVTLAAIVLAGALAVLFARAITRPILRLRDAADRISRGELDQAVLDAGPVSGEIGELTKAFRRMMTSIQLLTWTAGDEPASRAGSRDIEAATPPATPAPVDAAARGIVQARATSP